MPLELQVKLLRVLETGTVVRVGGNGADHASTCASSPPPTAIPREAVKAGKLREDLYYRLNVFPIALPPLRERRGRHRAARRALPRRSSIARPGAASAGAARRSSACARNAWPGNVRELRNVVQRALHPRRRRDRRATCCRSRQGRAVERGADGRSIQVRVGTSIADVERAADPRDARAAPTATRRRPPRSSASA